MSRSPIRQLPLPWLHRPALSREDFLVAASNRLAAEAIDTFPRWPHPVLFVHGPDGSGKTHLAEAFAARTGAIPFHTGDDLDLTAEFVAVVEDVDRTMRPEADLFALMNAARLGRGSVLVTSRVVPGLLPFRLPDLLSRLKAATTIGIEAPDEALLSAVLVKLFADRQLAVDPRLLDVILSRMERSLGAARRLVDQIDRASLATGRRVNRALVLEIVHGEPSPSR